MVNFRVTNRFGTQSRQDGSFFFDERPSRSPGKKRVNKAEENTSGRINELYRSFMQSYVRSINDSTFKVTIGGVRIGNAKHSRLAQINLKSRVITFSRYAIQNVPERGRRYLVLHELAHVLEPSHNKHFWNLVGFHEPDYKDVGTVLDKAFKKNVDQAQRNPEVNDIAEVVRALNVSAASDLIWTPDHGFIETGSRALGHNFDPLNNFVKPSEHDLSEEAFDEYLAIREIESARANQHSQFDFSPGNRQNPHEQAITSSHTEECGGEICDGVEDGDTDCFDEGYLDDFENDDYYGTMTGGAD